MSGICLVSFLLFILYAPITVLLRNFANIVVNNKDVIWTIHNDTEMMNCLKKKNQILYWCMRLEIVFPAQFVLLLMWNFLF